MIRLVSGHSMPNIVGWGIIKYFDTDRTLLDIGDVIVFRGHNKKFYCHRIISRHFDYVDNEVTDIYFTTKGDNFKESKPYEVNLTEDQIIGVVVWSYPDVLGG